jgi:DMSO reductase family type II enzyme heme b subunit
VRLFELWDNPEAVQMATVRAVSDGEQLTVLLSWRDPKKDVAGRSTTAFNDRAAIMLSADKEPPLFTMGRPGRDVEIWQWVPSPPSSIDNGAHNDIYPSKKAGWAQKRSADEGDFSTAKHVGNPVSRSHGGGTLFKAAKFGSLTAVPGSEDPSADAQWAKGEWKVMFRRPLHTTRADDIEFSGGNISVAFGIWDGRLGQRNGQKSVSIWGNLLFKKGK